MRAAKKVTVDNKLLQELVPLNTLSAKRLREISEKIIIEEVLSGRFLFRKGDRDNQTIYLLDGKVKLIDGSRNVTGEIEAGSDTSRHAIVNQQPRTLTARADSKCVIARIDTGLLDVFLNWDQSGSAEVVDIGSDENQDWMTRILQTEAFVKIPPSMIQSLLIKMESYPVKAGDVVISQGEDGDYFYSIHKGRCAVTRRDTPDSEDQWLAELGEGDSFGEDALVSDIKRNATVTMLTDGLLMRLAKEDFVGLLKDQLVNSIDYEQAATMVNEGAVWVDVRSADEYESGSFEDSVNIPLEDLRDEMSELVFNTKYIICCKTGRRSESAGFMLSHRGFDVYVLEGGMPAPSAGEEAADAAATVESAADKTVNAEAAAGHDEEKVSLRAENGKLRAAIEESQASGGSTTDETEQMQGRQADAIKARTLEVEELRKQLREMQSQADVAREEGAESAHQARQEMQQLQDALQQANERVSVLESEVVKSDEAGTVLVNEAEIRLQEQQELMKQLQDELAAAQQALSDFQDAAGSRKSEQEASGRALQEELQARTELTGNLQKELDDLRKEATAAAGRLQEEADKAGALREENAGLTKQLGDFQAALEAEKQEREAAVTAAGDQQRQLEQQLEELQASHDKKQQELSSVAENKEHADGALHSLQQDNERLQAELQSREQDSELLRTELGETVRLLDEQKEAVSKKQADREAAAVALQQQQAEWESERVALQQAREDGQHVIEELRRDLGLAREQAEEHKAGLENEQQEQLGKTRDQLQRLESENEELRNECSVNARELERTAEEKTNLESEFESHKEQAAVKADSSAEELQALREQLEAEHARAAMLEQSDSDKDVKIRDLQEEILQSGTPRADLEQELEALRRQHEDTLLQLEQQAGRTRRIEQEHDEEIHKAHEDLTRKNDNEKELQGQIDRLRKKLEQSTVDLKNERRSSQEDIDNIRDELHAERQARVEERAEMAARQRELKEQLSAIAVEHEAKLTDQSGVIEQAMHAGREEEQQRLHLLLEAQSKSEEQVLVLQQELQKAHEEVAELTRREKDRRQVDTEMMQEQNQQAVSTITQLESQLKQLTLDRDAALADQQAQREKMNTLRGEVEVARGLMKVDSQGQVEDPGKLRDELDESKKNMAIALRLRAEAEAARDQLIEERNALREKLGKEAAGGTPLHVPPLDAGKAGDVDPGQQPAITVPPVVKENPMARERDGGDHAETPVDKDSRQRSWLGSAIGLGVAGALVLAAWFLVGAGNPFLADIETRNTVADEAQTGIANEDVAAVAVPAGGSQEAPVTAAPVVMDSQPDMQVMPAVTAAAESHSGSDPETVVPEPAPARPAAIRTYQDSMKGKAKGPVMVELPAAESLMGSTGKSLNYDESPRHTVTLPGFSISKYEVTFAEYDKFARATGRRLPHDESWGRGSRPVVNVSWKDAQAYAAWLSKRTGKKYRLPTEAEWEYAARAGNNENIWWDSDADVKPANCFNCGSKWDGNRTAPAGSFEGNEFGLHDMAGNAQEWTEDCYHASYAGAPDDGSAWLTPWCTQRVVRGGGYTSPLDSLRNARRGQYDQDTRLDNIGFRVVRSN